MFWHNTRTVSNGLHGFPNHTYNIALKCFPWDPVQTYYTTILQNSLNKVTRQPQWCTQNYSTLLVLIDHSTIPSLIQWPHGCVAFPCSSSLLFGLIPKDGEIKTTARFPSSCHRDPPPLPAASWHISSCILKRCSNGGQQGMCNPSFKSPIFLGLELHINLKIAGTRAETQQSPPEMQLTWLPKRHIHAGIQAAHSPDPYLATAVCTVFCSECYIMK